MNQFQNGWSKIANRSRSEEENQQQSNDEPATVHVADNIYTSATGKPLQRFERRKAGKLVHYGFGTLAGIAYGVLSEFVPQTRAGFGSAFGSALFVGADEIGLPLAGLSKPASEYPPKTHIYAWASHLVYGSALEASRLATRKALAKATHERHSLLSFKPRQLERKSRQLERRARRAIKAFAA
jgi:uncharacterized membrane protein YagU involved in acid resistance